MTHRERAEKFTNAELFRAWVRGERVDLVEALAQEFEAVYLLAVKERERKRWMETTNGIFGPPPGDC